MQRLQATGMVEERQRSDSPHKTTHREERKSQYPDVPEEIVLLHQIVFEIN